MHGALLLAVSFSFLAQNIALCGEVTQGGSCSTADDHIDPASHKFLSDCDDTTFCSPSSAGSSNGTCQPRTCRRDEFPFGYNKSPSLPPLCSRGSFCPDEGSGCKPLLAPGQACQLNRDDQCAPPPDWHELASNQNFNGSLCLRSTCTYANASLGQTCIVDDVTYIDIGPTGQQYSNTITRDNCQTPKLYCDRSSTQCIPTKALGEVCDADRECQTYSCGTSGTCASPPSMPFHVSAWQFVVTAFSVVAAMATIIMMLVILHKRLRLQRYREIREYYEEQMRLRRSMAALHAAAAERYEDVK
ncbi:hypothetical protein WOLCODRAFT_29486 [Wolfiporia cocos MD-104 SS10]|uniref:Uncharacterized protein n=1 Tax=Wolfiporia cocos (strain MD-104) TaxID=742152 RepID=A0A2H3JAP6_WOLCO|nr:hypothetical protein WOLCODRAFT_29486 [Wolfiporia cocos MD-104 SS10]